MTYEDCVALGPSSDLLQNQSREAASIFATHRSTTLFKDFSSS